MCDDVFVCLNWNFHQEISDLRRGLLQLPQRPPRLHYFAVNADENVSRFRLKRLEREKIDTFKVIWKRASESITLNFQRIAYQVEISFFCSFVRSAPPQCVD